MQRERKRAGAPSRRKETGALKCPSLANVPVGKPRPLENSQLSALGECYVKANSAWTLPSFLPPVCCHSSHLYTFDVGGEELSLLSSWISHSHLQAAGEKQMELVYPNTSCWNHFLIFLLFNAHGTVKWHHFLYPRAYWLRKLHWNRV